MDTFTSKPTRMNLRPIMRYLDPSEPAMRIYPNYISLNASAVRLLGMEEGQYLQVRFDEEEKMRGRTRLYIGKTDNGAMAFRLSRRKGRKGLDCSSRVLAHYLSETLEGFGLYRICPEEDAETDGGRWFGIFFKRYD